VPLFHIQIGQGLTISDHALDVPNAEAAWTEAIGMLSDLARGIMGELKASPEWHLEVSDASGKALFKLQLTAEIFFGSGE
jgi:hypothetical protein